MIKDFVKKCQSSLPEIIMSNNKTYKLNVYEFSYGYRIYYRQLDTNKIYLYFSSRILDLFYNVVDVIPEPVEYKEGTVSYITIYKTSVDDIISDCKIKIEAIKMGLL